jgi:hypothetical protein
VSPISLVGGLMFAIMSVVSFLCKWFIALKHFVEHVQWKNLVNMAYLKTMEHMQWKSLANKDHFKK